MKHLRGRDYLVELVRVLLKSNLRGTYRLTKILANIFESLQQVPCTTSYDGRVFVDLRVGSSHGIFTGKAWEENEQRVVQKLLKEGDIAFDIGAHFGIYTVLLSHLVGPTGRVVAFEPNPRILPSLERTVKELDNVTLLPILLSNCSGKQTLYVPEDDSMASLAD